MARLVPDGTFLVRGEWPKCECGRRAEFMLGVRNAEPVCADGALVHKQMTGTKRKLLRLKFAKGLPQV